MRAVLAAAPTPTRAARLTRAQVRAALVRGGRQRNVEVQVKRLHLIFRRGWLHQLPLIEEALGHQALALLTQLEAACQAADTLAEAVAAQFSQHPDAAIIASFPGLGDLTGARLLAEIGDDRTRLADARELKAYAGAAPVTRASGRAWWSCTDESRTSVWPPSATSGPLLLYAPLVELVPTTTSVEPLATVMPLPSASCSTGSSAVSITASRLASSMPRNGPSQLLLTSPLDKLPSWDVSAYPAFSCAHRNLSRYWVHSGSS